MLPGGQERLLDGVLSVLGRTEDTVTVQLQLTTVPLDQLGEGIGVTGLRPGDQIGVDDNPFPPDLDLRSISVRLPV